MLDKQSEKILKYAISKYKNSSENYIPYINSDACQLHLSVDEITMRCKDLSENGYFFDFATYVDEGCRVRLTNKGLSYFELKKYEILRFWIPTAISIIALLRHEIIGIIKFILEKLTQ